MSTARWFVQEVLKTVQEVMLKPSVKQPKEPLFMAMSFAMGVCAKEREGKQVVLLLNEASQWHSPKLGSIQ